MEKTLPIWRLFEEKLESKRIGKRLELLKSKDDTSQDIKEPYYIKKQDLPRPPEYIKVYRDGKRSAQYILPQAILFFAKQFESTITLKSYTSQLKIEDICISPRVAAHNSEEHMLRIPFALLEKFVIKPNKDVSFSKLINILIKLKYFILTAENILEESEKLSYLLIENAEQQPPNLYYCHCSKENYVVEVAEAILKDIETKVFNRLPKEKECECSPDEIDCMHSEESFQSLVDFCILCVDKKAEYPPSDASTHTDITMMWPKPGYNKHFFIIQAPSTPHDSLDEFEESSKNTSIDKEITAEIEPKLESPFQIRYKQKYDFLWPSIEEFTIELGLQRIKEYVSYNNFREKWTFCINFVEGHSNASSDFFQYEVIFSIVCRQYPISQATASVHFLVERGRSKACSCSVDVTYYYEGTRTIHNPHKSMILEFLLFNIVKAKIKLFQTLRF